ncbi:MAG: LamG-like jellyroll fold domain-containing protein, partial [Saprospiraceae bacterium]
MMSHKFISLFVLSVVFAFVPSVIKAQDGQVDVSRIELMPNEPAPYSLRNWKTVAEKYDSFVYDLSKTGQYLPLVYTENSGINYPANPVFGLHTYVGTFSPLGNEAINVLPSLVGATLSGIDKQNQFGKDWVKMSQDFFNKKNGENIYLNNRSGGSGGDWWYDLMPNVYFYQLYDLYPNLGAEADAQFMTIADRFLASVKVLGGSDTPWKKANMDYRAFNFKTMSPNGSGVHEPESAGAYAWVLYHAYKQTGNPEYLKAAEWSLEFLSEWTSNPSYELQLPYGTYVAAKMNAELGTKYDVEKMLNWSFDRGALRGWGTIVGKWGGFEVSGLVGEANDGGNDYAFQLNGVQQAAMLVPMVRYDKRFARAIGKWMVNLSNATRLYYPGFLPANLQDASDWSSTNDPNQAIGYEALREKWQGNSPYSTGDALKGNWAATNLALYGSGSIGYLGAIVEKTNIPKILRLNLLKTDFYKDTAFPTYLYFNPLSTSKIVEIDLGTDSKDVYDAISEQFIIQAGSGVMTIDIPSNETILVTICPAGGTISYDKNKMLVNDVVVDFQQSAQPFKYNPRIQSLAAAKPIIELLDSTEIFVKISDQDSQNFSYNWSSSPGTISGTGNTIKWKPQGVVGTYPVQVIVTDESGLSDTATVTITVVAEINKAPLIQSIEKSKSYVEPSGTVEFTCQATDPNNDLLNYAWSSSAGNIGIAGKTVTWTAPSVEGIYQINVTVTDDEGLTVSLGTSILVKTFVANPEIKLIAYYPFNNSADDLSGNAQHGQKNGPLYVPDRFGKPTSACKFDGVNDNILVPSSTLLNCQDGITVSAWFTANNLPEKEMFLLSHGSWQNRWKVSITPERKLRWTVNSLVKVEDLDALTPIVEGSMYYLTVTYDGTLMGIYINGKLENYKALTGKIRTTDLAFLQGQILPGNIEYNFDGILDEVKLFDHGMTPEEVNVMYQNTITSTRNPQLIADLIISPNPVTDWLEINLSEEIPHATMQVYDLLGTQVNNVIAGPG